MISKKGTLTNLKKSPDGQEKYDSALEREYMVELERDPAVVRWTKKHGLKISYKFLGCVFWSISQQPRLSQVPPYIHAPGRSRIFPDHLGFF